MIRHTVKQDDTLLNVLLEVYKGASKQKVKHIMQHSQLTVNGKVITKHQNFELKSADVLTIESLENTLKKVAKPTRSRPIAIYFEDDYYMVGLKPAGILSCGDKTGRTDNSYHKMLESFVTQREGNKTKLWVVHRIDREVEGLLIFAKSEEAQFKLKEVWETVTKKYITLVENKPNPETGTVENWLRDGAKQVVSAFNREMEGSKFAKTEYKYLRAEGKYHVIEVMLHTGRKNQIRVHMQGLGCSIVGDRKYGADSSVMRQIRLAAYFLEFKHPYTGNPVNVKYYPAAIFFKPSANHDEQYKIV
ncbi:MAG TPA: hypothetical protein DCQ31_11425 [Bacteroidales bacterium]|nr:hypothetical protein [Bacteroidales bacterium]